MFVSDAQKAKDAAKAAKKAAKAAAKLEKSSVRREPQLCRRSMGLAQAPRSMQLLQLQRAGTPAAVTEQSQATRNCVLKG
jgi:hypothetical protein